MIEAVCASLRGFTEEYYERWKEIHSAGKEDRVGCAKAKDWQLVKTFGLGILDVDNKTVELWQVAEDVMSAYEQVQSERMKHQIGGKMHG